MIIVVLTRKKYFMHITQKCFTKKNEVKMSEKTYIIKFPPKASKVIERFAILEGVTIAELIRRAINFYDVKQEAERKQKKILLEDRWGGIEVVMI